MKQSLAKSSRLLLCGAFLVSVSFLASSKKYSTTPKETNEEAKTKTNAFSLVSDADVVESVPF